jgi:hypothetical protein
MNDALSIIKKGLDVVAATGISGNRYPVFFLQPQGD